MSSKHEVSLNITTPSATTDVCTAPLRELGGSSKTRSYVQGHRDVHYMDATFAFFSYLKLPARGYAKIPFSV